MVSVSKTVKYVTLDVFTKERFSGNPLAIVELDESYADSLRLRIAREFGYSETVFIPSGWQDFLSHHSLTMPMRIFTPTQELDFAGHPSIGTGAYIAMQCKAQSILLDGLKLSMPIGDVSVGFEEASEEACVTEATLPVAPEIHSYSLPEADLRLVAGLENHDLDHDLGPVCGVHCGSGFLFIPVASEQCLYNLKVSHDAWQKILSSSRFNNLYFFCRKNTNLDEFEVRMFGFGIGQAEDGGTGAAAAGLARYLAFFSGYGETGLVTQGRELGRQSQIQFRTQKGSNAVSLIGNAVKITQGVLYL